MKKCGRVVNASLVPALLSVQVPVGMYSIVIVPNIKGSSSKSGFRIPTINSCNCSNTNCVKFTYMYQVKVHQKVCEPISQWNNFGAEGVFDQEYNVHVDW